VAHPRSAAGRTVGLSASRYLQHCFLILQVDLSSSDVKSWQHVRGNDVVNAVEDKLLQAAADLVTFVFINRQSPVFDKVTVPSGT